MKLTKEGWAVLENDSHLSKWIEDQHTLEVAEGFCRLFTKFIPVGGVVIDVGACLGDHTATYSAMVGVSGYVIAFEPNEATYLCLKHNMALKMNVKAINAGLGDKYLHAKCVPLINPDGSENVGGNSLDEGGDILVKPLDDYTAGLGRLDFIKIDAEGWEPRILLGAKETIKRFRPTVLLEINDAALVRVGSSRMELFRVIDEVMPGYLIEPAEPHYSITWAQVDVLLIPN
jgi:FkbM family methyltransferase